MPISGLPSQGSNSSSAPNQGGQGTQIAPLAGQGHDTQASQSAGRRVAVGGTDASSSLEHEKAQSQRDLDQTVSDAPAQSMASGELQRRIAMAEAAVILMLNQTDSGEALERATEGFMAMELANVSGMERLVALEAMAFSQLSELLKMELTPLTATVKYSALPNGELRFVPGSPGTQAQEEEWEEKYQSLDEAVLRLVGTSGSAQAFNYGKRVASLERVVAKAASRGGAGSLSGLTDMVGGYSKHPQEARAQNLVQILAKHGDIEHAPGSWLTRAAKLEEVVLEALGFTPMTRSFAPVEATE